MENTKGIYKLKGKVQQYAWGGFKFLPEFLGIDNKDHVPFAEYWMGAHASASSDVVLDKDNEVMLKEMIEENAEDCIGKEVNDRFKDLPYLFKILDVNEMLSIQVHPTKAEAEKGFDREEAAGIPINAAKRNYKDRNHKPEVMVALSNFWLLHGFKLEVPLKEVLQQVPEFNFLLPVFNETGYYGLYKTVMELPQQNVDEILLPLVKRVMAVKQPISKSDPAFWVNKLFNGFEPHANIDRGIFSIYFFNIVEVHPGEAVFQGAGVAHAYLQGQNVELMANSDNVLRGGLTPKHIDVPELLKHTLFEGIKPIVLKGIPTAPGEEYYDCPVDDFGISAIRLQTGQTYKGKSKSAEIFVVVEGEATINQNVVKVGKGECFIVFAGRSFLMTATAPCLVFKAYVP